MIEFADLNVFVIGNGWKSKVTCIHQSIEPFIIFILAIILFYLVQQRFYLNTRLEQIVLLSQQTRNLRNSKGSALIDTPCIVVLAVSSLSSMQTFSHSFCDETPIRLGRFGNLIVSIWAVCSAFNQPKCNRRTSCVLCGRQAFNIFPSTRYIYIYYDRNEATINVTAKRLRNSPSFHFRQRAGWEQVRRRTENDSVWSKIYVERWCERGCLFSLHYSTI